MDRRTFVRNVTLAGLGAIFVPRYERWFRPLRPPVGLSVPWPAFEPGDIGILMVESPNVALPDPRGWTLERIHAQGDTRLTVYHRLAGGLEQPVRLPPAARAAKLATFRGLRPEAWTHDWVSAGPPRVPTFLGVASGR